MSQRQQIPSRSSQEEQLNCTSLQPSTSKEQEVPEDLSNYGQDDSFERELLEKQQEILEQSEAFQKQPLCISTRVKQLGYDNLTKGDYQQIGKIVKKIYVQEHDGINPPQREQYTYKAKCSVNCYYGYDRHIIDKAIYQYVENKKSKIQDN